MNPKLEQTSINYSHDTSTNSILENITNYYINDEIETIQDSYLKLIKGKFSSLQDLLFSLENFVIMTRINLKILHSIEYKSVTAVCSCCSGIAVDLPNEESTKDASKIIHFDSIKKRKEKRENKESCKFRLVFKFSLEENSYVFSKINLHNHGPKSSQYDFIRASKNIKFSLKQISEIVKVLSKSLIIYDDEKKFPATLTLKKYCNNFTNNNCYSNNKGNSKTSNNIKSHIDYFDNFCINNSIITKYKKDFFNYTTQFFENKFKIINNNDDVSSRYSFRIGNNITNYQNRDNSIIDTNSRNSNVSFSNKIENCAFCYKKRIRVLLEKNNLSEVLNNSNDISNINNNDNDINELIDKSVIDSNNYLSLVENIDSNNNNSTEKILMMIKPDNNHHTKDNNSREKEIFNHSIVQATSIECIKSYIDNSDMKDNIGVNKNTNNTDSKYNNQQTNLFQSYCSKNGNIDNIDIINFTDTINTYKSFNMSNNNFINYNNTLSQDNFDSINYNSNENTYYNSFSNNNNISYEELNNYSHNINCINITDTPFIENNLNSNTIISFLTNYNNIFNNNSSLNTPITEYCQINTNINTNIDGNYENKNMLNGNHLFNSIKNSKNNNNSNITNISKEYSNNSSKENICNLDTDYKVGNCIYINNYNNNIENSNSNSSILVNIEETPRFSKLKDDQIKITEIDINSDGNNSIINLNSNTITNSKAKVKTNINNTSKVTISNSISLVDIDIKAPSRNSANAYTNTNKKKENGIIPNQNNDINKIISNNNYSNLASICICRFNYQNHLLETDKSFGVSYKKKFGSFLDGVYNNLKIRLSSLEKEKSKEQFINYITKKQSLYHEIMQCVIEKGANYITFDNCFILKKKFSDEKLFLTSILPDPVLESLDKLA